MNELIERLFADFSVDGEKIPVKLLHYDGHGEPYVVYQEYDEAHAYAGDDELLGYVVYYDFDVYARGNFLKIISEIKRILAAADFMFQPSRTSQDFFETDTRYYHKTLCFATHRQEA